MLRRTFCAALSSLPLFTYPSKKEEIPAKIIHLDKSEKFDGMYNRTTPCVIYKGWSIPLVAFTSIKEIKEEMLMIEKDNNIDFDERHIIICDNMYGGLWI